MTREAIMQSIRRLPLVQQTLISVVTLCLFIAVSLSVALHFYSGSVARNAAINALKTQDELVGLTLTYAEEAMAREAARALEHFRATLPVARLTGKTINSLPELMFGDIQGNGNQAYLLAYKEQYPESDVSFMVRSGNALYRASTLLKNVDGRYRDGELIDDGDYTSTVLEGRTWVGMIHRNGKLSPLAVQPLKDESGRIIGAVSMRISVDENLAELKSRLKSVVLGKTGYFFAISTPMGDQKEAEFAVHPTLGDQSISASSEATRSVVDKILNQKNGVLVYEWNSKQGATEEKVAVFREIPSLHWIIVASATMSEYTTTYTSLTRWVQIGLAGMVLVLMLCLWAIIGHQLRPIDRLVQALASMGQGDLTQSLAAETGSHNEIEILAARINDSREAMKKLVDAIRQSSVTVTNAATDALNDMHSLSGNVDQLSSTSSQSSRNVEELSSAIELVAEAAETASQRVEETVTKVAHGKKVVHGVIDSIRTIETRVQSTIAEVESLTEHSHNIKTVVSSIGAIAGQTNLLALNAAIEAARAGEVGRGFAVVADEVRKLAEQSADSASEISKILNDVTTGVGAVRASIAAVVEETRQGTQASSAAGEALSAIEQITQALVDNVNTIAESATEQASAAQSMTEQVNHTAQIAHDSNKVARNVSQVASGLKVEAEKLSREVGYFKV
jgi:methyl-accepting chemotaxis protein